MVKIAKRPFARGTLRLAYYMKEILAEVDNSITEASSFSPNRTLVAKISIDPFEEKESYFHDVAMQACSQQ